MNSLITIEIGGTATADVQTLFSTLKNRQPVMQTIATAANRTLRDWFLSRSKGTNSRGWPSRGLWRDIAAATGVQEVTETDTTLAIAHPAIQRKVEGGPPIVPKRGRFLAIAAMAAAYAAGSPREGGGPGNLAFVFSQVPAGGRFPGDRREPGSWAPALAVQEDVYKESGKVRKDGTRRKKLVHQVASLWYWLLRSANPPKDENALPPAALLADSCTLAAVAYLNTRTGARSQI